MLLVGCKYPLPSRCQIEERCPPQETWATRKWEDRVGDTIKGTFRAKRERKASKMVGLEPIFYLPFRRGHRASEFSREVKILAIGE